MAEDLIIDHSSKEAAYQTLIKQLHALCSGEINRTANLANIAAGLKETFGFFWVGFYLLDSDEELVLGPFQGPVACTRIKKGAGVCGAAWAKENYILVPDVEAFPGHIACSSLSKSELVVPIFTDGKVVAVLDVDSDKRNDFDQLDVKYLNELCIWVGEYIIS